MFQPLSSAACAIQTEGRMTESPSTMRLQYSFNTIGDIALTNADTFSLLQVHVSTSLIINPP